ncbi:MAG: complex I subunit 1 family protein [Zestosphaera sp.]
MDVTTILVLLVEVLLFPGLLGLWVMSMFSEWWVRKLFARSQRRMGPSYVGPIGVLQPFADFIKLLLVKTEPNYKYGSISVARAFGCLGLGAVVASLLLLPIAPLSIAAKFDVILLVYLLGVWVAISELVMATSLLNPFAVKGVSRLTTILAVAEPAFFTAVLTPAYLSHRVAEPAFSVKAAVDAAWGLWTNPLTAVPMFLATVAALIALQSKLMLPPFNIPEAEQELIAGVATEFSGPLLAIFNFLHDADLYALSLVVTYLLLGGPHPFIGNPVAGIVAVVIKYLAVLTIITLIKSSFGRFRVEQGVKTLVRYALLPAVLAIVISTVLNQLMLA